MKTRRERKKKIERYREPEREICRDLEIQRERGLKREGQPYSFNSTSFSLALNHKWCQRHSG